MRTFLVLSICLIAASCGDRGAAKIEPPAKAPAAKPEPRKVRIMVVPFEGAGSGKELDYVSMGLTLALTERLEEVSLDGDLSKELSGTGVVLEVLTGGLVLTREAVRVRRLPDGNLDLPALEPLLQEKGVTHVLTGRHEGRVEKWRLRVDLYVFDGTALKAVRHSNPSEWKVFAWASDKPAPKHPGVQIEPMHSAMALGVRDVFLADGIVLPSGAVTRLSAPLTETSTAFKALSDAYASLLLGESEPSARAALGHAEHAVTVWPDSLAAKRLYGYLLYANGRPDEAWRHLAPYSGDEPPGPLDGNVRRPVDYRSLVLLGRIEVAKKDYVSAERHLSKAVTMRPLDAVAHFHLAEALEGLGKSELAIASFERAKGLDPYDLETRRRLAALFAAKEDFLRAAEELRVVVGREPENAEAAFLLAASLRAGGDLEGAAETYRAAAGRLKGEWRLPLFRGDVLVRLGRNAEAEEAYAEAAARRKRDPRADADGRHPRAFGLVEAVREADGNHVELAAKRDVFRDAHNDAVMELRLRGAEACGTASMSWRLAKAVGDDDIVRLTAASVRSAKAFEAALEAGEGEFLTAAERGTALRLIGAAKEDSRQLAELVTAYEETLLPMLHRAGCGLEADGPVADIADVRARNRARPVELDPKEIHGRNPLSPEIPIGARRMVDFYVVPPKDGTAYELTFVGNEEPEPGIIQGPKKVRFNTTFGRRRFCLLEKPPAGKPGRKCGDPGTVREADFFGGRHITIH